LSSDIEPVFARGHDGRWSEMLIRRDNPLRKKIFRLVITFPPLGRLERYCFGDYDSQRDRELLIKTKAFLSLFPAELSIHVCNKINSLEITNNVIESSGKKVIELLPDDLIFGYNNKDEEWISIIIKDQERFSSLLDKLWFHKNNLDILLAPVKHWDKVNNLIYKSQINTNIEVLVDKLKEEVEPIFIRRDWGRYIELLTSPDNSIKEKILDLVLSG